MLLDEIEDTSEVKIPEDPVERVIGQDNAVLKAKIAVRQRRHLLLVGPPGIGKSMLAQALAYRLPKPEQQISVLHNSKNPHRPVTEIRTKKQLEEDNSKTTHDFRGFITTPSNVPAFVAERLGFRCSTCGLLSDVKDRTCPRCGAHKCGRALREKQISPFGDVITEVFEVGSYEPEEEIKTTCIGQGGGEEVIIYRRLDENRIVVLNKTRLEEASKKTNRIQRNIIIPLSRKVFVHATGASETELLGDVRHDPYGSHPEIGTPAYLRVVPGAIHEAHEGVLFIDELPHLGNLQNFILTAMQEKKFPIIGRNPQSSGASVKVDDVPCDFLFVGACNIKDVQDILSPLRSRILGNGYEILLDTTMPDTPENRDKMLQLIAQEIVSDGRIPHASQKAVKALIEEAKKRARATDNARNSLTLRLRDFSGIVRLAGDTAVLDGSTLIEEKHIKKGIVEAKSIENQLQDKYGSVWNGLTKDSNINPDYDKMRGGYI